MKKRLCAILTIALLLAVAAAPAACAADEELSPVVLVAYSPENEDSLLTRTLVEYARLVSEASDGRITLDVYHSGLLGNSADAIASAGSGAIDIIAVNTSSLASICPSSQFLALPFLFDSAEQACQVANGALHGKLFAGMPDSGLTFLAECNIGMRDIATTGQRVSAAADVTGLALSVPDETFCLDIWTALGAAPTAVSAAELPAAANNGAAVAQDIAPLFAPTPTPAPTEEPEEPPAEDTPAAEEPVPVTPEPAPTRYYSTLGYMWRGFTLAASADIWNSLEPAAQDILTEQAGAAAQYSLDTAAAEEAEALDALQAAGFVLNDAANISSFRSAMGGSTYYSRYAESGWYSQDTLSAILAAKKQ